MASVLGHGHAAPDFAATDKAVELVLSAENGNVQKAAKRLGGGKNMGSQRSMTQQPKPPAPTKRRKFDFKEAPPPEKRGIRQEDDFDFSQQALDLLDDLRRDTGAAHRRVNQPPTPSRARLPCSRCPGNQPCGARSASSALNPAGSMLPSRSRR